MISKAHYESILEEKDGPVVTLRLNRPNALNALSSSLIREIIDALKRNDNDDSVRCMIITGSEKVFSAGADIKEMSSQNGIDALKARTLERFDEIQRVGKPIIAAVSGYCFGGGCELAMSCDIIIAGENAVFGQPEINLGVMPGAGGTQRLTRVVGKYRAMDMILTGKSISAREAYDLGLVSRLVPAEKYLDEARKIARDIAFRSPTAVRIAKECVLKSYETALSDGLELERRNFYLLLSSKDKEEGMKAFLEKRKPNF